MLSGVKDQAPLHCMRYLDPKYRYIPLNELDGQLYYEYEHLGRQYKRKVNIKCWLIQYKSKTNVHGSYFLATTISIDKVFEDACKTEYNSFDLCSAEDMVYLKHFFYGHDLTNVNYIIKKDNNIQEISEWLNNLIKELTGKNPLGHYNRHYIIDLCGVDLRQEDRIFDMSLPFTKEDIDKAFSKAYYSKDRKPFQNVIDNWERLAYGLIYGNENNDVVPEDMIRNVLSNSFSNNITERIFAQHKTEVSLQSHFPWPWKSEHNKYIRKASCQPLNNAIVYDMLMVMDAKRQLKQIEHSLSMDTPSSIKNALASISTYLSSNPYHLGEYNKRIQMLYRALGVKKLYLSIKSRGELLADSRCIEMSTRLNTQVLFLTAITALIGIYGLVVSILCSNHETNFNKSDMENCVLSCVSGCNNYCAIIGVLLGLTLSASLIIMAVYAVKSYIKLKEIERHIKELNR